MTSAWSRPTGVLIPAAPAPGRTVDTDVPHPELILRRLMRAGLSTAERGLLAGANLHSRTEVCQSAGANAAGLRWRFCAASVSWVSALSSDQPEAYGGGVR